MANFGANCEVRTVVLCLLLTIFMAISSPVLAECSPERTLALGAGAEDGFYSQFAGKWAEYHNAKSQHATCLSVHFSEGTLENLEGLRDETRDLGLIQNDLGAYAYNGLHGMAPNRMFLGVRPLFYEFVQIAVERNSQTPVRTLSQLEGKRIAVSGKKSGSYWNAIDILAAAGLKEGAHYILVETDNHPVDLIRRGEAEAAIYTSAFPTQDLDNSLSSRLQLLSIPDAIVTTLNITMSKSYYEAATIKYTVLEKEITSPAVAVVAFLAVRKNLSDAHFKEVSTSLNEFVGLAATNELFGPNFVPANSLGVAGSFPMLNFNGRGIFDGLIAIVTSRIGLSWDEALMVLVPLLVVLGYFLSLRIVGYDALGVSHEGVSRSPYLRLFFTSSYYGIGFALWFLWVMFVATLIQSQESSYSLVSGIESPLAGMDLWGRTQWLVRTAFTSLPGEVPLSPISGFLIPAVPIFGLGAFLFLGYTLFSLQQESRLKRLRGFEDLGDMKDHVLLCGWNQSAEGLVYSMTGVNTPVQKSVVVIADIDEETPFLNYNFDPKRVFYVRGDSAKLSTLRKAGALRASEAIVLAGDKKVSSNNIGSVLTVIALRKLLEKESQRPRTRNERLRAQPQALFRKITRRKEEADDHFFIAAELAHDENMESFKRAGADEVLFTQSLTDKAAALSILCEDAGDFLLDLLSFDDYFELYGCSLSELHQNYRKSAAIRSDSDDEAYSYATLSKVMMSNGIQVLGMTRNAKVSADAETLAEDIPFFPDIGVSDQIVDTDRIYASDRVIYFSDSKRDVQAKPKGAVVEYGADISLPKLSDHYFSSHVGVVSCEERFEAISNFAGKDFEGNITRIDREYFLDVVKITDAAERSEKILALTKGKTAIMLLNDLQSLDDFAERKNFSAYSDTQTLLMLAELGKSRAAEKADVLEKPHYRIIAEINDDDVRELFESAGADQLLPRRILMERVTAKMVFNHGRMFEFIQKLMSMGDGEYLRSYTVKPADGFQGLDIRDCMMARNRSYKVCAWRPIPKTEFDFLKEGAVGFSQHYITAFNSKAVARKLRKAGRSNIVEVGDRLILMYFDENHVDQVV